MDRLIPENEQGVVALFAMVCVEHGWTILDIGTKFPDASVKRITSGMCYRTEFEFLASNFMDHNHDIDECDLIVCWINDWPGCDIPIISLQAWVDHKNYYQVGLAKKEMSDSLLRKALRKAMGETPERETEER